MRFVLFVMLILSFNLKAKIPNFKSYDQGAANLTYKLWGLKKRCLKPSDLFKPAAEVLEKCPSLNNLGPGKRRTGLQWGRSFAELIGGLALQNVNFWLDERHLCYSQYNKERNPKERYPFDEIYPGLFLGNLPTATTQHAILRAIKDEEGKGGAVLAMVQDYELKALSLLPKKTGLKTITPKQWNQQGVAFKQVSIPDHGEIDPSNFHRAITFVQEQRKKGEKVYIHCKGGKSRSLAIAIAALMLENPRREDYLCRHQGNKNVLASATNQVFETEVRPRRPQAALKKAKLDSIVGYFQSNEFRQKCRQRQRQRY